MPSQARADARKVRLKKMTDTTGDADPMLPRREAASFLRKRGFQVAEASLATWASRGGGPRYYKFGPKAIYKPSDLLDWAEAKLSAPRCSTAEADCAEQSAPRSLAAVRRAHPDALGDEGAADA
jgi:hypothetical protein